ncbi:MAG: hypothetical protein QXU88_02700 [Candidatus Woesearchaeota archaeon]
MTRINPIYHSGSSYNLPRNSYKPNFGNSKSPETAQTDEFLQLLFSAMSAEELKVILSKIGPEEGSKLVAYLKAKGIKVKEGDSFI